MKTTYELLQWGLRLEKELRKFQEEIPKDIDMSIDVGALTSVNPSFFIESTNGKLKEKLMNREQ